MKRKKSFCLKAERSGDKFMTFSGMMAIFSEAGSADTVFIYFLPIKSKSLRGWSGMKKSYSQILQSNSVQNAK
ncbi:MAG: hypothetical protein IK025_01490 [Bacteroidales bacterium]|nr:hypothetical protein [Bacteroidales bacterium]